MEKIDLAFFLLASLWGFILGLFYFGGLWWTLKVVAQKRRVKSFLLLSFFIRTVIALLGFWIIMRQALLPFLCTFAAFLLVRIIITRKLGLSKKGDEYAG
ncbi:ATP synthase subunit I [Thermodesulfobacteriota bacterium]